MRGFGGGLGVDLGLKHQAICHGPGVKNPRLYALAAARHLNARQE